MANEFYAVYHSLCPPYFSLCLIQFNYTVLKPARRKKMIMPPKDDANVFPSTTGSGFAHTPGPLASKSVATSENTNGNVKAFK